MTLIDTRRAVTDHDPFPLHPPADWFAQRPEWLEPLQKSTIVTLGPEAGRVAGYVAPWEQCLLDGGPDCWTIPSSPTGYAVAQQGDTETADGQIVKTANLGGGVNHARIAAGYREAVKHYHNTAAQFARVQYHEDEHGVYFAGAAWPDATPQQVAIFRASAVSGDWRYLPYVGGYDLCGVQMVNSPGFPLIRKLARAAGLGEWLADPSGEFPPVYIGGLGGVGQILDDDAPCCEACGARTAAFETRLADVIDACLDSPALLDHIESALAQGAVHARTAAR